MDGREVSESGLSDRAFVLQAFVVPGLVYPVWHFAAPRGAVDPFAVWLALGAAFQVVPLIHLFRPFSRPALQNAVSCLAALVTLHLFVLASLNEMAPFFAVGSAFAVFATVLFIRSMRLMIGYAIFVVVIASVLFAVKPDGRKAAYWGGTVPVLVFGYSTLSRQVAQRRELERQVRARTLQLSLANQRLRDEIDERPRLEDELRVAHKMEAVGRLAGGVAHDFNNLVTTIGVYAELVTAGLPAESPLHKEVDQIRKTTRQMATLTQQLLTLGRRSHVPMERLDLNAVISDAAPMLRHLMGSHVELELMLAPEPQFVWGDIDQLQQVLINLAINARDAMPEPGRFTIETSRCSRALLSTRGLGNASGGESGGNGLSSEDYVLLAVSDEGVGMTAEERERAFDPFFTTKEPGVGTGLGLSIVHGIVSQANGLARIESEPGRGTRFELYWPFARGAGVSSDGPGPGPGSGHQEEILLVEDEKDLRDALHRALRSAGYRVTGVGSAEEALAMAALRERSFDLLVTDVVMGRMSGFELAERMTGEHPATKILLISGHLSDRALADASIDHPFLAKPFDASDLRKKVRELLDS